MRACGFSRYANRRGAKSAKSPLDTFLALLVLPHTRELRNCLVNSLDGTGSRVSGSPERR
jgi:hypothetical protein